MHNNQYYYNTYSKVKESDPLTVQNYPVWIASLQEWS